MNNFDIDEAVGYVNKIIENVRCATCDRLQGSRLRYSCGHTACDHCVNYTEECQLCSSPSPRSDSEPNPDNPLTLAAQNAINLLKASHSLFDVKAFHHKRISEQLKIEKELFPKCIQAPMKYENKRKSINLPSVNKENKYSNYFPGEAVSVLEDNKMENSVNNVQQWLNKYEKNLARTPFGDLNVNTQQPINTKNKLSKPHVRNENVFPDASRKRSHFKCTGRDYSRLGGSRSSINEYSAKKVKKEHSTTTNIRNNSTTVHKCDNDESGIFMDNDPIVIDDSQESVIDKDKNAWLAVLNACENEDLTSTSLDNSNKAKNANDSNKQYNNEAEFQVKDSHVSRVPFFKRSAIIETCSYCKNEGNSTKSVPASSQSKPVKITIDNDNFLTTITVFKNVQNGVVRNTSSNVSVQTDICKTKPIDICVTKNNIICNEDGNVEKDLTECETECLSDKQSEDLFADDRKIFGDVCQTPEISRCIVIDETDSDTDLDESGPMSVQVDVHRSCQDIEYGILDEVHNVKEHETRSRPAPRGHTPTSTDSSEKENYNPNRFKKHIAGKKKFTKK